MATATKKAAAPTAAKAKGKTVENPFTGDDVSVPEVCDEVHFIDARNVLVTIGDDTFQCQARDIQAVLDEQANPTPPEK